MPVDRLSRGVGEIPGERVAVLGNLDGTEPGELLAGQAVLLVEVGGDHEESVVLELSQGALEHASPQGGIVPEILVAEKGEIEAVGGGEGIEKASAILDVESGLDVGIRGGLPTEAGFRDLGRPDIGPHDFEGGAPVPEDLGEDPRFVGPATGEVEEAAFPLAVRAEVRGARRGLPSVRVLQGFPQGSPQDGHVLGEVLEGVGHIWLEWHGGPIKSLRLLDSRVELSSSFCKHPKIFHVPLAMAPPSTSVQPLPAETESLVRGIADQFAIEGEFLRGEEVESGHINSTYLATYELPDGEQRRYILQRINEKVFKDPLAVMRNVECVTSHINWKVLRKKRDLGGQTLSLYPHKTGRFYGHGEGGGIWRCYNYFEGCQTYDVVENSRQAYEAGHAFGAFQDLVSDLPAEEIVETIPDFHHTRKRYEAFMKAVEEDRWGRVAEVQDELDFIRRSEGVVDCLLDLKERGAVPLRITHNDTKINNVLFDVDSHEAVCVIDLDTVMPGLSLYDFGDLVRTATNPAAEDERDLSKVQMRLNIFEALVEGYLEAAGGVLNDAEVSHMVFSGRLISLELGMRFLTDHLNGDQYFPRAPGEPEPRSGASAAPPRGANRRERGEDDGLRPEGGQVALSPEHNDRPALRRAALEGGHALEVLGLGKEVEGLHRAQLVSVGGEGLEVADLRGGIAGNVDHPPRRVGKELFEEVGPASLARGIDDDRRFIRRERNLGENVLGGSGVNGDVGEGIVLRVATGPVGRGLGDLHAGHLLEAGCEGEGEEPGAAVGIDEETAVDSGFVCDVRDEGGQDEGIVLEEIAGKEAEGEVAHPLFHDLAGVGVHSVGGGAQEKGGALLELSLGGGLVHAPALGREGRIQFVHRDRAGWDIDDLAPRSGREEPDGEILVGAWLLKMGSELRAVVPGPGRGNGVVDGMLEAGHVAKEFPDLPPLPGELRGVVEVLILTPSAPGEEGTDRFAAVGSRDEHLEEVGVGAVGLVLPDAGPHAFARQAERHEKNPAVDSSDSRSEVGEGTDLQLDGLVIGKGFGAEVLGRGRHFGNFFSQRASGCPGGNLRIG